MITGRRPADCFAAKLAFATVLFSALIWAAPGANGQTILPPRLHVQRVAEPPKLEDFLSGAAREIGGRVSDFRQREPNDGAPVSQPTTAYLSYDDKNFYVVFVCREEPGKVRARMVKREDIWGDDQVSVYLDTFYDRQRAYIFSTNPLGIQRDSILTEGQGEDGSFDTLWYSRGKLTDFGFVVWMAIPFKSLRFPSAPRQEWGVALGRSFIRNNDKSFWPHISLRSQTFVGQMAPMEGLEDISPGHNVQIIPYATFAHARLLDTGRAQYLTERDKRFGLDSKIVLKDAFTLDATLNPDFSQVESDDPQVTINQRFEVFFPEKRPFFLENAGFFQTPVNLFFSRRIIDPKYGARLTGKVGRWAIGALAADDRAAGLRFSPADPLHDQQADIGVVRVQREFGKQSRIGVFASTREFGATYNRVFSADTRLQINPNWYFTGQAVQSYSREQDGRRRTGPSYYAELGHSGQHFSYTSKYTDRSPDFRADLGFIPRVDIRQGEQSIGYFFRPESSYIVGFGPSASAGAIWDRRGTLTDWWGGGQFDMFFTGPTGFTVSRFEFYQLYLNQKLRTGRTDLSFFTSFLRWLDISASFGDGTNVNYNPAAGLLPFVGDSLDGSFRLTFRPTPRFRWDNIYFYNRLVTRDPAPLTGDTSPTTVFNSQLLRSKLNYQFTRRLTLRTILDYYGILPNSSLIWQDDFKQLIGDVLLTYQVNAGTALHLGYTNRFQNLALEYGPQPRLVNIASPSTSTARQLFVKISYLLRF